VIVPEPLAMYAALRLKESQELLVYGNGLLAGLVEPIDKVTALDGVVPVYLYLISKSSPILRMLSTVIVKLPTPVEGFDVVGL